MQPTPWFPRRDLPISLRVLGGRFFSWFHRLQRSKHVLRRDVQARLSQSGTHHSSWRIFRWTCLPKGKGSFGDDMYVFVDGFLGSPPTGKKWLSCHKQRKSPLTCAFLKWSQKATSPNEREDVLICFCCIQKGRQGVWRLGRYLLQDLYHLLGCSWP